MKGVLKGPNGESFDLTLHDVAVVENFHVNIISEARLYKTGLWFCGMDCTLRWNEEGLPIGEHHVVRQLERRQNLVFFEYKPRSIYSPSTRDILSSAAGTVMFPTLSRRVNKPYRPSRDYEHPRTDSERVWHLRAGHLGADALRKLTSTARNVRITEAVGRIKCEQCALTHAAQVISRRPPERKSPRPFWRITWDLFDYPKCWSNYSWLLVLKCEYSGLLVGYALQTKEHDEVFQHIESFEA
jgi:hypothetical protein